MPHNQDIHTPPKRADLTLRIIGQADEWRHLLSQLPSPHVLQSWEWGEIKTETGWRVRRFAVDNSGKATIGAFQLLLRSAPARLPFTIGYIPKGPVLDWSDSQTVDALLDHVQQAMVQESCLFVKIDPDVGEKGPEGLQLLQKLRTRGWQYSHEQIQFKNTAISRLDPKNSAAYESVMAQMKSKWRYNIRLAQRRGIEIRVGNTQDFEQFYDLYIDTSERDGFAIRPFSYYERVWNRYLAAQLEVGNPAGGILLLAQHANELDPVSGLFLMKYGQNVWYFYGASSERRRRDMPNYLLQWHALKWALEQGATHYDWWGAPTEPDNPDDGMRGVWRFKEGFGAEIQINVGAWDWAPSNRLYQLYRRMVPFLSRISRYL